MWNSLLAFISLVVLGRRETSWLKWNERLQSDHCKLLEMAAKAQVRLLAELELIAEKTPSGMYVAMLADDPLLRVWLKSREYGNYSDDVKLVLVDDPTYSWTESRDAFFRVFPCLLGRSPRACPAVSKWSCGRLLDCIFAGIAVKAIKGGLGARST
jgi:hypothetical protein